MGLDRRRRQLTAATATTVTLAVTGLGAGLGAPVATAADSAGGQCRLGDGVKHVISLVFDNVHFARDNPNVPSDLEQMPHLLSFLTSHGTVLSNTHTPLIAHTADDSLTIYTGLYGDRHGQPVSNSYRTYNPDGSTDPAGSFAYWTDPVYDTAKAPAPGHDTAPTMAYSATVPAAKPAGQQTPAPQTPAPWVPFTRAGCSVGNFSTANMVLENTKLDLPNVFGTGSPELAQYTADPSGYKDAETADYVGVAVHCAAADPVCGGARAVKYGQTAPSPTAVADATAHRTRRLPRLPGALRGPIRRPAAGARHPVADARRLPSHRPGGKPHRPGRRDPVQQLRRSGRGSPGSTRPPRRAWPTSPTCRRTGSR